MSGESKGVNIETATQWKESELIRLLEGYSSKDVFNADEIGLFFNFYCQQKHCASERNNVMEGPLVNNYKINISRASM